MRKFALSLAVAIILSAVSFAQQASTIQKVPLGQAEIDRILKKVTANEGLFRSALADYNFSRKAVVQTIGMGGQITGEFRRDSEMIIPPQGTRFEKILFRRAASRPGACSTGDLGEPRHRRSLGKRTSSAPDARNC